MHKAVYTKSLPKTMIQKAKIAAQTKGLCQLICIKKITVTC